MKIDKQLPAVSPVNPQERRRTALSEAPRQEQARRTVAETPLSEQGIRSSASFSIQLNQQLSALQSAERYLGDLEYRLSNLKLALSRELSAARGSDKETVRQAMRQVNDLLERRAERSGNALDSALKLHLNEPVRSRFSLPGLDSLEAIRQSGKETLLFSAGRSGGEPAAVVLKEGLGDQQMLRSFNAGLAQLGIRAELDENGRLKFSARESDWQAMRGQLAVQGEGKLFPKGRYTRLEGREDRILELPDEPALDSRQELRAQLDSVVAALDKVVDMREQIAQRREEIRAFLERQSDQDEKQWALGYAGSVFTIMRRNPSSYAAVTQAVMAQANLSRFAVVSLLS